MTLRELKIGESAVITEVGGSGELRQHFLDMGVIPGAEVTLVKFAPMGDPMELKIHGYELTLRLADADKIDIVKADVAGKEAAADVKESGKKSRKASKKAEKPLNTRIAHPGLGEGGKYHDPTHENPLPDGTVLTFALAGNQNCGKTTLFNQLTGSNQHVGNFPGVTVDRKSGVIRNHADTEVTDLPGIYSLSPYTSEEVVSRNFIIDEKPKGIINIVDATNIERNMYLTMQLIELDVPMVLALNMMDEMTGNGGAVKINEMEDLLGIPVVPISAAKNEGITELINHAVHVAKYQENPGRHDFCPEDAHGGAVHRAIHSIMHLIDDHAIKSGIPTRFAATKVIEGDKQIIERLSLTTNEEETIEHIVKQMEEERGMDRAAAIADMRYAFIEEFVSKCVIKPHESKERTRSIAIDKILTGKFTAIPSFILIMAAVFVLTFNVIGAFFQGLIETGIDALSEQADVGLTAIGVNEVLHSLIIDGIFTGVGAVVSFLPIIVTLFFFLSLLEDTGYMARVAFIMDKLLRRIGLSGRSIVPMLIGFGCSVPAIMSSRTLPSERDRKLTIFMIPFMSCTAKLPIYGFFIQAFFPNYSGLMMTLIYLFGIGTGIFAAHVSKNTVFKGEAVPFVMELPNYRLPGAKNVALLLWDKAKDFLQRAFTIIFIASIVIWFLQTFDFRLAMVGNSEASMLGVIAGVVAPIFKPLGFGDFRIATALVTGFVAKESVVSTLSVLLGDSIALSTILSKAAALSLLTFCLLYTPCVAAIAAVKRELGRKWALAMIVTQCTIAWVCGLIVHLIAMAII
ncbi:MAG: ferrous iron transport protein B [Lachnospiraceae bacterium]|nr:ferrous iron transport protein B [Lachnospiraceae bacterium]